MLETRTISLRSRLHITLLLLGVFLICISAFYPFSIKGKTLEEQNDGNLTFLSSGLVNVKCGENPECVRDFNQMVIAVKKFSKLNHSEADELMVLSARDIVSRLGHILIVMLILLIAVNNGSQEKYYSAESNEKFLYFWTFSLNSSRTMDFDQWIEGFESRYTKEELLVMREGFNDSKIRIKIKESFVNRIKYSFGLSI